MKKIYLIVSFVILSFLLIVSLCFNFFQYKNIKKQKTLIKENQILLLKKNDEIESLKLDIKIKDIKIESLKEDIKTKGLSPEGKIHYEVQECMKKENYTTSGMANCVLVSETKWEKEISKHLAELKELLTSEQYKILIASQNEWEKYRQAQKKLIYATIFNLQGTIHINIAHGDAVGLTESRAKDLNSFIRYMKRD